MPLFLVFRLMHCKFYSLLAKQNRHFSGLGVVCAMFQFVRGCHISLVILARPKPTIE